MTLSLRAKDDVGVTGYYLSESDATPDLAAAGWVEVASDADYSANVGFTLGATPGLKNVYVRFRDAAGNVSESSGDAITLFEPNPFYFKASNTQAADNFGFPSL